MTQDDRYISLERSVLHTEVALFGMVKAKSIQIPMWLHLKSFAEVHVEGLSLVAVQTENQWHTLRELRRQIEVPFGITEMDKIDAIMAEIRTIVGTFSANWFVAYFENVAVGSIGIVDFRDFGTPFGRLLDVDILPDFQGRGHGNRILSAIFLEAHRRGLSGLCLKADEDRWVKHWYARLGFEAFGIWHPKKKGE
jgi:GNAT superfamily N-acetyltransferase